jgi:thiamine biosynthesis lipoprotein
MILKLLAPGLQPLAGRRILICPSGRSAGVAAAMLIWLLVAPGCARESGHPVLSLRGETMGTTYSIQIVASLDGLDSESLATQIDATLEQVNARMSTYRPDSELSRFNASASTDWFPVSAELAEVVRVALRVSQESSGAFDITVGPLVNLWGFGPGTARETPPTDSAIAEANSRVGWQQLSLREEPPALHKQHPGLYVDVSAIAKGYAVDRVAQVLENAGIQDYLVEVGGELRGHGRNGRGVPWQIAIERPDVDKRAAFRVVALQDSGMATSGDYRNFFEVDGKRYSHTIDPATGRPVVHQLASVTVLADSAMFADAWATALLVLGPERGMAVAKQLGLAAMFIEHEGDGLRVQSTEALLARITAPDGRADRSLD